ncbi:MAG: sigma-70 family RNA polymerase sigma factor [Verrucomicrobiales bacterium]
MKQNARDHLVLSNRGLVVSIAKGYQHFGLDLEDLTAAGTIGLMQAIDQFDFHRGYCLSTYATNPIRSAISRALSRGGRCIYIPEGKQAQIRELKKLEDRLFNETGCEPSVADIAREMDLPVNKVGVLRAVSRHSFVSLDTPLGDGGGLTIGEVIEDSSAMDPQMVADRAGLLELVAEAEETLDGRERTVYMQFKTEPQRSLREIGIRLGVSGERVRQIRKSALEKVRAYVEAKDRRGAAPALRAAVAVPAKPDRPRPAPAAAEAGSSPPAGSTAYRLKMRAVADNPNHHITNNNGIWYCKFTLVHADGGKTEIRNSLHTDNVVQARRHRDRLILLYLEFSGFFDRWSSRHRSPDHAEVPA